MNDRASMDRPARTTALLLGLIMVVGGTMGVLSTFAPSYDLEWERVNIDGATTSLELTDSMEPATLTIEGELIAGLQVTMPECNDGATPADPQMMITWTITEERTVGGELQSKNIYAKSRTCAGVPSDGWYVPVTNRPAADSISTHDDDVQEAAIGAEDAYDATYRLDVTYSRGASTLPIVAGDSFSGSFEIQGLAWAPTVIDEEEGRL